MKVWFMIKFEGKFKNEVASMAFVKTESYFNNKIENIKKAIIGTEKDLAKARAEFEKWSNEN